MTSEGDAVIQNGVEIPLSAIDSPIVVQGSKAKSQGVEWGGSAREAGAPDIEQMLAGGFSDGEIEQAIKRQVQLAEQPDTPEAKAAEQIAQKHGLTRKNLPGTLHLFFYTDKGRNFVRSILWSNRFSRVEVAGMLNVGIEQLNAYLQALGWNAALEDKRRNEVIQQIVNKTREAVAEAQGKCVEVAAKMLHHLGEIDNATILGFTSHLKDIATVVKSMAPAENAPVAPPPTNVFQFNWGVRPVKPENPQIAKRVNQ